MTKSVFATFVHLALASDEDFALNDDALSLLQTRVHKHEVGQGAEYFLGPKNTLCEPEEVLTLAQCLEVQAKRLLPHAAAEWSIMGSKRSATTHRIPSGCSIAGGEGGSLEWSDEPVGTANAQYQPVCSKNGGRAAEIATQGMSCQEPTCIHWNNKGVDGDHLMNWNDDGVVVPELKMGTPGGVCEDACGILTYAQCAKAGDTGMLEALNGVEVKRYPQLQCNGGGHSRPAVPSGCWFWTLPWGPDNKPSFCPYDTSDGALAEWVSDSGVGVGWASATPICGVCTTTTTTPEPPPAAAPVEPDQAAAVGDPHVTTNSGNHFDLKNPALQRHGHDGSDDDEHGGD